MDKHICKISVHEFVDWVLEGGDLVFGASSAKRLLEGTETHIYVQNLTSGECEVPVRYTQLSDLVALEISGRIDILHEQDGKVTIEELKSTYSEPDTITSAFAAHELQAKCYAAIYCTHHDLDEITYEVTYVSVKNHSQKSIAKTESAKTLITWLHSMCDEILYETELDLEHKGKRNSSAKKLRFPFGEFREGQRNMSGYVYLTERDSGIAFLCAPTGIGKTMGALYPSVKAMGEGMGDKIFYLTAKNTIKQVAAESMKALYDSGFFGRSVLLTAKSKICPYEHQTCHPMYCKQAAGYYGRLPDALEDMRESGHYGREDIEKIAQKHNICPFELSLDFSLKCDVIICDYNHGFDPVAHLKRYFDDGGDYMFLIDEAHNLVDRARYMFSATVSKADVLSLRRKIPKNPDKNEKKIKAALTRINKLLLEIKKEMEYDGITAITYLEPPLEIQKAAVEFMDAAEPFMDITIRKSYSHELFDLYFDMKSYISAAMRYNDNYRCYSQKEKADTTVKILCVDPSNKLQETYDRIRSAVLFSASLTPFSYFSRLLCAAESESYLLPSPFPPENLKILVNRSISTKYGDRRNTAKDICENIHSFVCSLQGRHMVFFPSYKYMEMIYLEFMSMYDDVKAVIQQRNMTEEDREAFLYKFEKEYDKPFVAFAVLGGVFSEGIDLVGDRLIGAIVVGIGLPMMCRERDLIRDYHFEYEEPGYAYAYAYPGFNKIIQAVGRIIRTKSDKGAALLIGQRFTHSVYSELMPSWWHPLRFVANGDEITKALKD